MYGKIGELTPSPHQLYNLKNFIAIEKFSIPAQGTWSFNGNVVIAQVMFIIDVGTWNYHETFLVKARNGAVPDKTILYKSPGIADGRYAITANGDWGWTIGNITNLVQTGIYIMLNPMA